MKSLIIDTMAFGGLEFCDFLQPNCDAAGHIGDTRICGNLDIGVEMESSVRDDLVMYKFRRSTSDVS